MARKDVSTIMNVADSPNLAATCVALLAKIRKDLLTHIMDTPKRVPFVVAFTEPLPMPIISMSARTIRSIGTHIVKSGDRNAWIY